jgi:PAS domain S-box-containing protein
MTAARVPIDEAARLEALRALGVLGSPAEERFDRITRLALRVFGVPIALVTLVDEDEQWVKSRQGLTPATVPRSVSFCAHAVAANHLLVVPDTLDDDRFSTNPLVVEDPFLRFYAGHPLHAGSGHAVGTLCVADRVPRLFDAEDREALATLAEWVEIELNRADLGRAMALRRSSEGRLRAILESLAEGIVILDSDNAIESVNGAAESMFGRDEAKLVGQPFTFLLDRRERRRQVPERGRRDFRGARADGSIFPLELSVSSITNEGRRVRIAVASDVSERHELERLKDEFIALVSHELRTPLTSIGGFVDLVLDGEAGPVVEEQQHALRIVRRNVDRLQRLVDDLLFLHQLDAGAVTLTRAPVQLSTVARDAVAAARPHAERSGIDLALDVRTDLHVEADRTRVAQALDNLVSNGLKFTPRGGSVTVRVFEAGDDAVVEVADTGIGIADEERSRLFERFFRTSAAVAQGTPGTGLGLVITKSIIEAHGGRLDVESAPGAGTTFRVQLPLSAAHEPAFT